MNNFNEYDERNDSRKVYRSRTWQRVRLQVLERDGYQCQIRLDTCTRKATAVDHIIPISRGGDGYEPTNLRACCKRCNSTRANQSRRRNYTVFYGR